MRYFALQIAILFSNDQIFRSFVIFREQCPLRTPRRRVYPTIVRTFVPLANSPMPMYFTQFAADMKLNLFM